MNPNKHYAVKNDIAEAYAQRHKIPVYQAKGVVNDIYDIIGEFLVNDSCDGVIVRGLFSIEKVVKKERTGKIPLTGEPYIKPANVKLKITTGKPLFDKLNK